MISEVKTGEFYRIKTNSDIRIYYEIKSCTELTNVGLIWNVDVYDKDFLFSHSTILMKDFSMLIPLDEVDFATVLLATGSVRR